MFNYNTNCLKCILRSSLFLPNNDPGTPKQSRSCSNSTPHCMVHGRGWPINTCGRPHGNGGQRSSSRGTQYVRGIGPGRPVTEHGPPHVAGGAVHVEPTARPGPSNYKTSRPARPGLSQFSHRPGPALTNDPQQAKKGRCLYIDSSVGAVGDRT